jgi:signal peptidase I
MLRRKLQLVLVVLLCLAGSALTLSVFTGTVKVFRIPTNGMAPTIRAGDYLLATRVFSPEKSVKAGDLVIFDSHRAHPTLGSKYVQRLVAIGGDRIEVIGGQLHVNGVRLPEREGLFAAPAPHTFSRFPAVTYPLVIPPGQIFTLGDNYGNSLDSRYFGPFPVDAVTHTPDCILFPAGRAGQLD